MSTPATPAEPADQVLGVRGLGSMGFEAALGAQCGAVGMLVVTADSFNGATDVARTLVRAGMRTQQLIGMPEGPAPADADARMSHA